MNLIDAPINHLLTKGLQLVGDRTVVDDVADAEDRAADQLRIDVPFGQGFAAEQLAEVFGQCVAPRRRPAAWPCSAARGRGPADGHLNPRLAADRPQTVQPAVTRQYLEKIEKPAESFPWKTWSNRTVFSSCDTKAEPRTSSSSGNRAKTSSSSGVELVERPLPSARLLRRAEQCARRRRRRSVSTPTSASISAAARACSAVRSARFGHGCQRLSSKL